MMLTNPSFIRFDTNSCRHPIRRTDTSDRYVGPRAAYAGMTMKNGLIAEGQGVSCVC